MARVLIIADDLTGALDSAVAFTMHGARAQVALQAGVLPRMISDATFDVVALATGTRDGTEEAARAAISALAPVLQSWSGIILKKIDSRMKGHVAAELAELTRLLPRPVLACPALPRLGRVVTEGAVTGAGVATPIPVAPVLGRPAQVVDATRPEDIAAALPARLDEWLYLGAGGLAEALAERLFSGARPEPKPLEMPALFAIGSRDPVTLAQIDALDLPVTLAPNGAVPDFAAGPFSLLQMVAGPSDCDPGEAGTRFAEGVARAIKTGSIRTILACGGESAHAILRAAGCHRLEIEAELFAGLPLSRCTATGLRVLTKSGGFGSCDLLRQVVNRFANPVSQDVSGESSHRR